MHKNILAYIFMATLYSCGIYSPGYIPVPLHTKAGELKVAAAYSAVEGGYSAMGTTSLTDRFSVGATWSQTTEKYDERPGYYYSKTELLRQHYGILAGYTLYQSPQWLAEVIASVGRGYGNDVRWKWDSTRTNLADTVYLRTNFTKYALQVNFGYITEKRSIAFTPRLNINVHSNITDNGIRYSGSPFVQLCFEPAFTFRQQLFGKLDVFTQLVLFYPITRSQVSSRLNDYSSIFVHVGLMLNMDVGRKK
ncbi:MAG: hypothetical protein ACK45I_11545 [Bacteroidota bacterium]